MNNKKGKAALIRFFRPSMRLYFAILICILVLTLALRHWELAAIQAAVVVLLLLYTRLMGRLQKRQVLDYVGSSVHMLDDGPTSAILSMPLPMTIFNLKDGNMLWSNDEFLRITGEREHTFEVGMADLLPDFSLKWLAEGRSTAPDLAQLGDRQYRVYGNVFRLNDRTASGGYWGMTYFVDVTEYAKVAAEYSASRPVVAVIMLDNYDELFKNLNETAKSALLASIDNKITDWCAPAQGYLCRYDRDRYIFIFEERHIQSYLDGRFSLLDTVRELQSPAGIAATISIGVGRGADTLDEGFQFAMLGIEMALSRGGDQAVVKSRLNFDFFGGKTVAVERRTKVKSRVMASALGELITDASSVLVMGHKYADLDSIGAAVALCCIARKKEKPARIVVNSDTNVSKQVIERLKKLPEYAGAFISEQEGLVFADGKTLLVVVDTNRPDQVESEDLLMSCNKVAVVDHHRRAADYIANAALNFHEPYASSASELATELMQYLVDSTDILKAEAEAVLAGIVLDTKNFTLRTGSRTFEAAAFLRRSGSDTTEVKKLFQNDLDSTVAKYAIIQSAKMYHKDIAIAESTGTRDRIIAAQAADELINIRGIEASFVLYEGDGTINISARSIGAINVQLILERLGGGGNRSTAGAQLRERDAAAIVTELKAAIDDYLKKDYGTEGSN